MTTNATASTNEPQTLAQRLAQGRIPAPEAERYAMILAEALRKIHDAGHVHGGVSPASIVLTGSSLELLPAAHTGTITPYTAPELLQGRAADCGSDVFAFGAVVYEMFSGRRAFEGDGPAALSAAINTSTPPSCGSPAMDRLLSNCLAKDPTARWQRMHKILMELKLLTVLARRAEVPVSVRREQAGIASLRADMQQLEGRVAARLQAWEAALADTHQATTELGGQLAAVNAQVSAAREQQVAIFEGLVGAAEARLAERLGSETQAAGERVGRLEQALEATETRLAERLGSETQAAGERVGLLEQALEATEARLAERLESETQAAGERVGLLEQALEEARKHTITLHESVSEDFLAFEQSLKSQAVAIESTRTAMAQTDDLVERVVEALESLQSFVLEPREEPAVSMN